VNRFSLRAAIIVAVVAVVLWFGGQMVWHAMLAMHGVR
jgi:hypothetical protein